MRSVKTVAKQSKFTVPFTGKAFASKFGATTLRTAIAVRGIRDFHRRTGADFGKLGVPLGRMTQSANGVYIKNYQLGSIHLNDINSDPAGQTDYVADVVLSAFRCFGTQDPDGSDSTYAVISLISVDPNGQGSDALASTGRTEIINNVHEGDAIFKMRSIERVDPVGSGILHYGTMRVAIRRCSQSDRGCDRRCRK